MNYSHEMDSDQVRNTFRTLHPRPQREGEPGEDLRPMSLGVSCSADLKAKYINLENYNGLSSQGGRRACIRFWS